MIAEEVVQVNHRHVIFTIDEGLRVIFQMHRELLKDLMDESVKIVQDWVLRLDSEVIEPPPLIALGMDSKFIRGVGKIGERLLILLELDQIMGGE